MFGLNLLMVASSFARFLLGKWRSRWSCSVRVSLPSTPRLLTAGRGCFPGKSGATAGRGVDGFETHLPSQRVITESGKGLAPTEIFHARPFRLFRRLRTRSPALILQRQPDAQTSSPAGFFRAGCPQKSYVRAKSPHGRFILRPIPIREVAKSLVMLRARFSPIHPPSHGR